MSEGNVMTVSRILALKGRDVVTIQPHRTIAEASRLLSSQRIGAVLVTGADGHILGILSERDIVRAVAKGPAALEDAVSRHMTERVITCAPDMLVFDVMETMTQGRFRHLPVVDQDRLVGIISIGDVVKHRLAEIEAESRAMRDYITTA
jgi:CBS domain-containing protein